MENEFPVRNQFLMEDIKADIIRDAVDQIFHEALFELLETKDFQNISVSDILKQSGLSRSTFYRHFKDKYDLAMWGYKKVLGSIFFWQIRPGEIGEQRSVYQWVYEHRRQFRKILSYTGPNDFYGLVRTRSVEFAEKVAKSKGRKLTLEDYYTIDYHSAGFWQTITSWMQSRGQVGPEAIQEIISRNRNQWINELIAGRDE